METGGNGMNEANYAGVHADLTGKIINLVELKAVCTLHPVFAAQCRTYLRMLDLPVGLVLNFGFPSLKEGIEHVSNPRSTYFRLQNSKTPSSESNINPHRGQ